ncbi:hypothetical protein KBZ21_41270, partial [Streptomyces sp. A73]|nr:hypothetical protein [Streptomyces sp. A73]
MALTKRADLAQIRVEHACGLSLLVPDQEPDAEPITYAMQCAVCDEQSAASLDYTEGHAWALRHSG